MARPRWKNLVIAALKSAVALVVLWAVGRHVLRTWNDWRDRSISLHFEPGWLIGSGLLYLAGLSAFGRFYERILNASATPVPLGPAVRAYLVSHLGKYVPGKAMVVVIRTGMVVPFGARASTAAIATFYETLMMMAAGGLIAAVGFAPAVGSHPLEITLPVWGRVEFPVYRLAALSGLGSGLAFLVLVLPPVFARLVGLASLPIPGVGPEAMPRLNGRLLVQGLFWSSAGWVLLGLSQLAVVRAFDPEGAQTLIALGLAPVVIASVALATVAGFLVAVLPGGLGVREGVLMSALAPALGSNQSVAAALTLRLVWVVAELAAAAVLVPWSRRPSAEVIAPLDSAAGSGSP
jgi:glycosyltransferase 2 family protein